MCVILVAPFSRGTIISVLFSMIINLCTTKTNNIISPLQFPSRIHNAVLALTNNLNLMVAYNPSSNHKWITICIVVDLDGCSTGCLKFSGFPRFWAPIQLLHLIWYAFSLNLKSCSASRRDLITSLMLFSHLAPLSLCTWLLRNWFTWMVHAVAANNRNRVMARGSIVMLSYYLQFVNVVL